VQVRQLQRLGSVPVCLQIALLRACKEILRGAAVAARASLLRQTREARARGEERVRVLAVLVRPAHRLVLAHVRLL
jgi:hypothetical protein